MWSFINLDRMEFLSFRDVSFVPNSSIGRLCEDLKNVVGEGNCYDTFQDKNTKCLRFVNDIFTTMNFDKVWRGSFGLYPSYAAGILDSVNEINLYVLCSEKLNSAEIRSSAFFTCEVICFHIIC